MRRVVSLVVLVALAALPALAQDQPPRRPGGQGGFGGFGRGGSAALYLTEKSVQEDLKLTADQLKKVNDITAKQKKAMEDLQNVEGIERFKKMAEVMQANEKAFTEVLNADQAKRLKQITMQVQGVRTVTTDPNLAKELSITEAQQEKFNDIQAELFKQTVGLRENVSSREELRKKTEEINKATVAKFMAVLTPEQKAKWKEMTGEPFKGAIQPRFPGFGKRP